MIINTGIRLLNPYERAQILAVAKHHYRNDHEKAWLRARAEARRHGGEWVTMTQFMTKKILSLYRLIAQMRVTAAVVPMDVTLTRINQLYGSLRYEAPSNRHLTMRDFERGLPRVGGDKEASSCPQPR